MMRRKFIILFLLISLICCLLVVVGCKDKEKDKDQQEVVVTEEAEPLSEPNLVSATFYKCDAVKGFYVGNGNIVSLKLDGKDLSEENDYVINGGWLVLKMTSWEEIGVGEHALVFDFDNYEDGNIVITITDTDTIQTVYGGNLTVKDNLQLWTSNSDSVQISYNDSENALLINKVSNSTDDTKNKNSMVFFNADFIKYAYEKRAECICFDYKGNETVVNSQKHEFRFYATETTSVLTGAFDSFNITTDWQKATIDLEEFIISNQNSQYFGIILGGVDNSTLLIKNWRLGSFEELKTYRTDNLIPNYDFIENNVGKWAVANTQGLELSYDNNKGMKLKVVSGANGGLWLRDCVVYTTVKFLKIASSAGYEAVSFTVKADDEHSTYEPGTVNGRPLEKGIRVFSKTVDGRDTGMITDGNATGVKVYNDFGKNGELEFNVKIVIDDFFALNEDVKYLGLCVATLNGHSLYLSNLQLVEGEKEPELPPEVQQFVDEYGFNAVNSKETKDDGKWDFNSYGIMSKEYDSYNKSMKVTMSNSSAVITGRDFVIYTSIEMLKEAKEQGFDFISFKVASDDGAFLTEGKGIRIYSKTNEGKNGDGEGVKNSTTYGTYIYNDFGLEANITEFTVEIDIDDFMFLNENANYLGIVINIPKDTSLNFSKFMVKKYVNEEEKLEKKKERVIKKYGFNEANSKTVSNLGIWNVVSSVFSGISYNASKQAMQVNMSNTGAAISGRDFIIYTSIDMLKDAKLNGFDVLSFTVSSDNGAFTDSGRGIRIYSKVNAGRDSAGITTNASAGIYEYGDFGLEAGTTSFTVTIDIDDFMTLCSASNYLGIVLNVPGSTSVYFSDLQVGNYANEQERITKAQERVIKKYGFNEANSKTVSNLGIWNVVSSVFSGISYNASKQAMQVNMLNTGAAISGRDFIIYTSIDMLKDAKLNGFDVLSFTVSSDNGAFTDSGRGIRIYSKVNAGRDSAGITTNASAGIYEYGDFGLEAGTTSFTVTIDIDDFMALCPTSSYLGIVLNVPGSTSVYFSNLIVSINN